jgi:hypothetical protein
MSGVFPSAKLEISEEDQAALDFITRRKSTTPVNV